MRRILRLWLVLSIAWIVFVFWYGYGIERITNELPCALWPTDKTCFGWDEKVEGKPYTGPVLLITEQAWTVGDLEELFAKAFGPPLASLGLLLGLG